MSKPLVYILQEEKSDLFRIGITKNLNKDYDINRQGNCRSLLIYNVFSCDPKNLPAILESYRNRHKGQGWYAIKEAEVRKIVGLLQGNGDATKK
jgi:hypothetical protein